MEKWPSNFRYIHGHLFIGLDFEVTYMLQFSIGLCKDLEIARMISEFARTRELQKLKQAQIIHETISNLVFPYAGELCTAFLRENFGSSSSRDFIEVCNVDEL